MRTLLLWVITLRVMLIPYRHFRTDRLLNYSEEVSSHLLCGGSLKSNVIYTLIIEKVYAANGS